MTAEEFKPIPRGVTVPGFLECEPAPIHLTPTFGMLLRLVYVWCFRKADERVSRYIWG